MATLDELKIRQNAFGDAAAATSNPGLIQYAPNYGPAGLRPRAPAAVKPTQPAQMGASLAAVRQASADEVRGLSAQGNTAQAIGASVRGDLASVPAFAADVGSAIAKDAAPVIGGISRFASGLFGGQSPASPANATPAVSPAGQRSAPPTASAGLPGYENTTGPANLPEAASSPNLAGLDKYRTNGGDIQKTVDANGRTTYSGTNISGPVTINGKEAGGGYMEVPGARGVSGLAGNAGAPSGLSGVVGGLGVRTGMGDFQSGDAAIMAANLRDGVDVNRGTSWGGGPKMQVIGGAPMGFNRDPRIVADEAGTNARVAQAMGTDAASIQRRQEMGLAGIRNAAEMASINQRSAESQARLGLDMRRLQGDEQTAALEREKTGLGVTALQEDAQLRAQMADPKATEAQRKIARDALLALQGKTPQNEWGIQVTPTVKNLDGSTSEGSVYRYNKNTGEVARVDGAKGPAPIDQNPSAIAIRDNANLTVEQKREALRKLGYA